MSRRRFVLRSFGVLILRTPHSTTNKPPPRCDNFLLVSLVGSYWAPPPLRGGSSSNVTAVPSLTFLRSSGTFDYGTAVMGGGGPSPIPSLNRSSFLRPVQTTGPPSPLQRSRAGGFATRSNYVPPSWGLRPVGLRPCRKEEWGPPMTSSSTTSPRTSDSSLVRSHGASLVACAQHPSPHFGGH